MSLVEQSLDPAVVVLDDAVFRDIHDELGVAGVPNCAAFVLVELCERGLQTAVVDAATGVRLVERGDPKLSPRMLDLAIADHLVHTGRVQRPESAEWAGELIDLTTELRSRLAVADGAFAMGADHIGLLRVSRRDLLAALRPHLLAAQELWQSAALHAELPVGAIVFMSDHLRWPGLFTTLAQLSSIPAVALNDRTPRPAVGSRRHGANDEVTPEPLLPDDAAPQLLAPGPVVIPAVAVDAPVSDPERAQRAPVVELQAADEPAGEPPAVDPPAMEPHAAAPTVVEPLAAQPSATEQTAAEQTVESEVDSVGRAPVPAAAMVPEVRDAELAVSPPPVPVVLPRPFEPQLFEPQTFEPQPVQPLSAPPTRASVAADPRPGTRVHSTHEQDVYFGSFAERGPISVNDHRDVKQPGGPRHYSPPVSAAGPSSPEARRVHNRRLLLGAAAVASSAAVGVVVLTLPWIEGSGPDGGGQIIAAQASQQPASTTPAQTPATERPPIDTGAARAPASQYVPAPSPTAQQQAPARTTPRRATPTRPRPRPRSIPNPIPGLPPILLP